MTMGTARTVQRGQRLWLIQQGNGGGDDFVRITTVQQAGLHGLNDGAAVTSELQHAAKGG